MLTAIMFTGFDVYKIASFLQLSLLLSIQWLIEQVIFFLSRDMKYLIIILFVELGIPRTQNAVESWHNRWKSLLGRPHVGVIKTMMELQKEEHTIQAKIRKGFRQGFICSSTRKKFIGREHQLNLLLNTRDDHPIVFFLECLYFRMQE